MSSEQQRVAVLDTGYESFSYEESLLKSNGYAFDVWPGDKGDIEGKMAFAAGAVGLLIRWTEVDDAFFEHTPGLQAIVRYGVGFENVDVDAATRAGVKVCNVQNYGNHAVSDHAIMLMYACSRGSAVESVNSLKSSAGTFPMRSYSPATTLSR